HALPSLAAVALGAGRGEPGEHKVALAGGAVVALVTGLGEAGLEASFEDELGGGLAQGPPPVGPALVGGAAEHREKREQQKDGERAHGAGRGFRLSAGSGKGLDGENGRYQPRWPRQSASGAAAP